MPTSKCLLKILIGSICLANFLSNYECAPNSKNSFIQNPHTSADFEWNDMVQGSMHSAEGKIKFDIYQQRKFELESEIATQMNILHNLKPNPKQKETIDKYLRQLGNAKELTNSGKDEALKMVMRDCLINNIVPVYQPTPSYPGGGNIDNGGNSGGCSGVGNGGGCGCNGYPSGGNTGSGGNGGGCPGGGNGGGCGGGCGGCNGYPSGGNTGSGANGGGCPGGGNGGGCGGCNGCNSCGNNDGAAGTAFQSQILNILAQIQVQAAQTGTFIQTAIKPPTGCKHCGGSIWDQILG